MPACVRTIVVDTRLSGHIFTLNIAPSLLNAPCYSPLSTPFYLRSFLYFSSSSIYLFVILFVFQAECVDLCWHRRLRQTKGFDSNTKFLLLFFHNMQNIIYVHNWKLVIVLIKVNIADQIKLQEFHFLIFECNDHSNQISLRPVGRTTIGSQ